MLFQGNGPPKSTIKCTVKTKHHIPEQISGRGVLVADKEEIADRMFLSTSGVMWADAQGPTDFCQTCEALEKQVLGVEHPLTKKLQMSMTLGLRTPRPATEPRNGPTRNSTKKYRKNTPQAARPKFWNSKKIPSKYRYLGVFLGIFGVFWG